MSLKKAILANILYGNDTVVDYSNQRTNASDCQINISGSIIAHIPIETLDIAKSIKPFCHIIKAKNGMKREVSTRLFEKKVFREWLIYQAVRMVTFQLEKDKYNERYISQSADTLTQLDELDEQNNISLILERHIKAVPAQNEADYVTFDFVKRIADKGGIELTNRTAKKALVDTFVDKVDDAGKTKRLNVDDKKETVYIKLSRLAV